MAWTTPTYAGQWAYGANGVLKTALFELCRAVNERQDCLGLTKTSFANADGTPGTDLVLGDFTNMFTSGPGSQPFAINCQSIMAAIKALAPHFCPTSGIATPYTVGTLETAVGLGTFLDEPRKANDPLFFQQCQDALDLLIYARRTGSFLILSTLVKERRAQTIVSTDREAVWDNAVGATPTNPAAASATPYYEYSLGVDGKYVFCSMMNEFEFVSISMSGAEGVITAAQYTGATSCSSFTYDHGGSMTAYIGSTSFAATVSPGDTVTQTLTADETEITMGAISTVKVTCDLPATCPLDALSLPGDRAGVHFNPIGWIVYFDIAAELTDQA